MLTTFPSPDIPAFAKVKPGEIFNVQCHEWTGGQIANSDDSDDVKVSSGFGLSLRTCTDYG